MPQEEVDVGGVDLKNETGRRSVLPRSARKSSRSHRMAFDIFSRDRTEKGNKNRMRGERRISPMMDPSKYTHKEKLLVYTVEIPGLSLLFSADCVSVRRYHGDAFVSLFLFILSSFFRCWAVAVSFSKHQNDVFLFFIDKNLGYPVVNILLPFLKAIYERANSQGDSFV